ncbi:hypothetical protein [Paraburkholderia dipogonis]
MTKCYHVPTWVDSSKSPLRRPRGIDTLAAIAAKNAYVTQEADVWKEV